MARAWAAISGGAPNVSRRSTCARSASPVAAGPRVGCAAGVGPAPGVTGGWLGVAPLVALGRGLRKFLGPQAARAAQAANKPEVAINWRRVTFVDIATHTDRSLSITIDTPSVGGRCCG